MKAEKILVAFFAVIFVLYLGLKSYLVIMINYYEAHQDVRFSFTDRSPVEPENPEKFGLVKYELLWGLTKTEAYTDDNRYYSNGNVIMQVKRIQLRPREETVYLCDEDYEYVFEDKFNEGNFKMTVYSLLENYKYSKERYEISQRYPGACWYGAGGYNCLIDYNKDGLYTLDIFSDSGNYCVIFIIEDKNGTLSMDDLFDFASRVSFTYEE